MEDAGKEPWASRRIRVLELAIDMGEISELSYPKPPEEPSGSQMTRIRQLETFYKRIAVQHHLTNLCLKIAHTPATPTRTSIRHSNFEFPSMLYLEPAKDAPQLMYGRPRKGYLQMFSGLGQLKSVTGSFGSQLHNPSKAELDWLGKYWPKFQLQTLARDRVLKILY